MEERTDGRWRREATIPGLKRSRLGRHHRVMPCLSWQASHVMNPRGILSPAAYVQAPPDQPDGKHRHAVMARMSKRNCNLQFSSGRGVRLRRLGVISEKGTGGGG